MAPAIVVPRKRLVLLAAAGFVFLLACGDRREPSLLLVTIDTLRMDRLGCYGAADVLTAHLDRLASEGTLFADCTATMPSTGPSHATILSGLYPHHHGVKENAVLLPSAVPLLSEAFHSAGYATAAFVSGFPLEARFGLARGFDRYDDRLTDGFTTEGGKVRGTERIAEKTVDAFLRWLSDAGGDRPFFAWVHLFDPHAVYSAPPPFRRMYYSGSERDPANRSLEGVMLPAYQMLAGVTDVRYPIALYEGEVTYTDHEVGRMIDALQRSPRGRNTLLVVVGDHGESLTDHGYYFGHSRFLYEASLRVPLFFRWPGRIERGRIVEDPVSLVDLAPTLLDLLGIAGGWRGDGRSLLSLLAGGGGVAPAPAFLERPLREGAPLRGIREGEWKYLREEEGAEELYRLDVDPGEARNLAASDPEIAGRFREKLLALPSGAAPSEAPPADEETREKLRALGYVP